MAETTGISWCDATFNPWVGCEKVSPGCANCYAEDLVTGRMGRGGTWGADGTRERTSPALWRKPSRWQTFAEQGLLPDGKTPTGGRRPRVFCASLADVFEPRPELDPWRADLFDLIARTPALDWLVLTKRPEYARDWLRGWHERFAERIAESYRGGEYPEWARGIAIEYRGNDVGASSPPTFGVLSNVWMGTSIENARHTYRADVLREIPAAVRFISAEPLLGSLYPAVGEGVPEYSLRPEGASGQHDVTGSPLEPRGRKPLDLTGIDWVIVGGESGGRDARPMHPGWARELRDAVLSEGDRRATLSATCSVPVECDHGYDVCPVCDGRPALHFKQWGSWTPAPHEPYGRGDGGRYLAHDGRFVTITDQDAGGEPPYRSRSRVRYAGAAPTSGGHLLDGVVWREFPKIETASARCG